MASDLTKSMAVVRANMAASRFRRWNSSPDPRRRNLDIHVRRLDGTRHRSRGTTEVLIGFIARQRRAIEHAGPQLRAPSTGGLKDSNSRRSAASLI